MQRFLTRSKVLDQLPFGRVILERKIKSGEFPAPIELGPRRHVWRRVEIDAFISKLAGEVTQ